MYGATVVRFPLLIQCNLTLQLTKPPQILVPSGIIYIFSVMMTSIATAYWHFMLAQGVVGGLSMGMVMAPCMGAIGHYFNKKRGAAMGLAISGSSLGGVMFPLALGKMLFNPKLSFGWSIRICGFIMIALMGPAVLAIKSRLPTRSGRFFLPAAFKNKLYVPSHKFVFADS